MIPEKEIERLARATREEKVRELEKVDLMTIKKAVIPYGMKHKDSEFVVKSIERIVKWVEWREKK